MTHYKNYKNKKIQTSKGETLIELLISIFILTLVLTVILAVFISGRAGVEQSWDRTDKNECASNVMEQLKSSPYPTLLGYRSGGATNIRYTEFIPIGEQLECANFYEVEFDLLSYNGKSINKIMQINVRVEKDGKGVEIGSLLLRKGESP